MARRQSLASVEEAAALGLLSLGLISGSGPGGEPVLGLRAIPVDRQVAATLPAASTLDIVVDSWSNDTDRQKLLETLRQHGPAHLRVVVEQIKSRAGYISQADRPLVFGELAIAAEVHFDTGSGQLEIETRDIEPVRLAQVVISGRSASK